MNQNQNQQNQQNSTPKYKLRLLMSPDGYWKVEYPPEANPIPLKIFMDIAQQYEGQDGTSMEVMRSICREYETFIKDRVNGLSVKINDIECFADISWDSIKLGI